ncbi:MAG: hypothetical protein ACXWEJ_07785 [Actinomycetota bacterium]
MDDYSALAYRIAGGVADVRGCLILSRDGLILGSYPEDESAVKPAWVRFASLGDPERSFVEFGDQVWVYVRRPAYGAFAVANAGVRPGLVIDQLEGILASAEESRSRRDTLRLPDAVGGPSGRPLTSLRPSTNGGSSAVAPTSGGPEARHWARSAPPAVNGKAAIDPAIDPATDPATEELARVASAVGRVGDAAEADGPSSGSADVEHPAPDGVSADASVLGAEDAPPSDADAGDDAEGTAPGDTPDTHGPNRGDRPAPMELDADAEVDPVMLAKEFSGLLQVESGDDEATS